MAIDKSIQTIQSVELDILKQILRIIDKYHLRYYMLGGTLLGAVRHQGFIPWDDDIDIGMPRPDYEKFLEVADAELSAPYDIHTTLNGRGEYSYYYPRVVNTEVKLRRKKSETEVIIPAWVDVFPLDGVPETESEFKRWKRELDLGQWVFMFSQFRFFYMADTVTKKRHARAKIAFKRLFYRLNLEKTIDTVKAWKRLDRVMRRYDYENSTRLYNVCGYWGVKELFPKSVYGKGRLYPFEDLMLCGPEDYDDVLTQMYGDYMTPPPEADRDHHGVELIAKGD